jgi:hypothetical protein
MKHPPVAADRLREAIEGATWSSSAAWVCKQNRPACPTASCSNEWARGEFGMSESVPTAGTPSTTAAASDDHAVGRICPTLADVGRTAAASSGIPAEMRTRSPVPSTIEPTLPADGRTTDIDL